MSLRRRVPRRAAVGREGRSRGTGDVDALRMELRRGPWSPVLGPWSTFLGGCRPGESFEIPRQPFHASSTASLILHASIATICSRRRRAPMRSGRARDRVAQAAS